MGVFDNDIISKDFKVSDFYNIKIENAAYYSISQNLRNIFGESRVSNYNEEQDYVREFFDKMSVPRFENMLKIFKKESSKRWEDQNKLHMFLWLKMRVRHRFIRDAHFDVDLGGRDYCIFIPNGEVIEWATADDIRITINRK